MKTVLKLSALGLAASLAAAADPVIAVLGCNQVKHSAGFNVIPTAYTFNTTTAVNIVSVNSPEMCLTVNPDADPTTIAPLTLSACAGFSQTAAASQLWLYVLDPASQNWTLRPLGAPKLCIAKSNPITNPAVLARCDGGLNTSTEVWTYDATTTFFVDKNGECLFASSP
jgi:hypothetical protein